MKIFGNTSVQGRIAADTGSFKVYGIQAGDQTPKALVAGTDAVDGITQAGNRSIVAHGHFDYIISSQDSGDAFSPAVLSPGSVSGFRVQHVNSSVIYTLRVERSQIYNGEAKRTTINISRDGGRTFNERFNPKDLSAVANRRPDAVDDPNAYIMPVNTVGFDMYWLNENEGFVVGAKLNGPDAVNGVKFSKFQKYGFEVVVGNADYPIPVILKKEANATEFVEWGTPPSDVASDCLTALAVDPNNSDILIVGSELGRLYKSTNGGSTWSYVGSIGSAGTCVNRIKFVTGNSNIVYAVGVNGKILKSSSGGDIATWLDVDIKDDLGADLKVLTRDGRIPSFNDILLPNTNDVIVVGDDHTRILKSSDSGVTWKYVSTGIYSDFLPIENAKSLAIGKSNYYVGVSRNKLFAAINPDVLGQQSRGKIDWVEFNLPDDIIDINLVSDQNPDPDSVLGYAHILTKTGLYEFSLNNFILGKKQDFSSVVNDVPTKLFTHSYREIYIITANSKVIRGTKYNYSFQNEFRFVEETSGITGENLIAIHSATTGRIFAGSDNGKIIFKDTGSITNETTYSTDPVTWSLTTANPTSSISEIIQLHAFNNVTLLALVEDTGSRQSTLFKSENSGSTWTQMYAYPTGIKKFIAFDTASIYAINQAGTKFYYTTSSFAEIKTSILDATTGSYADVFQLDNVQTTQNNKVFLIGGAFGIRATQMSVQYPIMGPWTDAEWTLTSITGEDGFNYWIAGGTTFAALQSGASPGSEPILLKSENGGDVWESAVLNITEQEPPLGDFTITSISEGTYFVESGNDVFNIYGSDNNASTFQKTDSNLFRDKIKYPGNLDGIKKLRFYDSLFGVAVSDIVDPNNPSSNAGSIISTTIDGGNTWQYQSAPELDGFKLNSVFITTQSLDGKYEVYVTAYPIQPTPGTPDGYVFKSLDSGQSWKTSLKDLPSSLSGLVYQPQDIFFVNASTGSVTIRGDINGSPSAELIYRTGDGGTTWDPITITDFAAGDTRGHLQFITKRKGYVAGTYGSNKNAGLFKTTDAGLSWTRLTTNYDATANKPVTAMHFLTEGVGVIGIGSEIWKSTNSGSSWTKVHDLSRTGVINEIKFSGNSQLGLAVGHYSSNNTATGEHFVLKSTNSGSTWLEVDSSHRYVDLEFEFDREGNLIGQPSTLYTIGFAEKIILSEDSQSVVKPKGPDDPTSQFDCFGSQFMSASFYNFENFAYRCTPSGSKNKYYPNISNNIGLGRGIFGQRTVISPLQLKNTLTFGAALGVGALGKSEFSKADTAAGFGAMDQVKNANHNVAIGYKALSRNVSDDKEDKAKNSKVATDPNTSSALLAITATGQILKSEDGGESWAPESLAVETGSYATSSYALTSSIEYNKIYTVNANESFALSNDLTGSSDIKTIISKINLVSKANTLVYSSSVYNINSLQVLSPSAVCGLDISNKIFLKSVNGAKSFTTGSIQGIAGNTIKSFRMTSENNGFIVGSKIWKLQSGSNSNWETSSYSGSHTLNAIDSVNSNTWIAVGTSGSIYRTTDKGVNWNYVTNSIVSHELRDVKTLGSKIFAVGNSGSILYSRNSGITWNTGSFASTGSRYGTIEEITVLDANTILVKHTAGVLKSLDGGKTWHDSALGITNFSPYETQGGSSNIRSISKNIYSSQQPSTNPNYDLSADKATLTDPLPARTVPTVTVNENVAVGAYAMFEHENSSKMVGIGYNALRKIENNKGSQYLSPILETYKSLGVLYIEGPEEFEYLYLNDLITTTESIKLPANYGQVAIGAYSQNDSKNTKFNTSVGYGTLYNSVNAGYNTAVGFYSQHVGQNYRNTSLGMWALGLNGDIQQYLPQYTSSLQGGNDNIAIGYKTLLNNFNSVRAEQILKAGFINAYRGFSNIGSRNIAIGNYALFNASGSADTIAIGYNALSDRGFDLTDSVFIGNYVGQNFGTKIGTYYSGSNNNDWKFTQTVAVGSRALQNHIGYDIVAVGANALRGTQTGSNAAKPDDVLHTSAVGILAVGMNNGLILTRNDFKDLRTTKWSKSNYVKKSDNAFSLYDDIPRRTNDFVDQYNVPSSIAIVSRDTAYGVIIKTRQNGKRYPVLVKTENLAGTNGKNDIEWSVVNPGLITIAGELKNSANMRPVILNMPDENTAYMLVKFGTSASGLGSISYLYKATSTNKFEETALNRQFGVGPFTFNKLLTSTVVDESGGYSYTFTDMHFPTASTGMVIGNKQASVLFNPKYFVTTDGGSSWTSGSIDTSESGSGVLLNCVYLNQSGSIAFAAGTYGSIYKWVSGSGWSKKLGASISTNYEGTFWDTVLLASAKPYNGRSVKEYFLNPTNPRDVQGKGRPSFFDIKFFDDNRGIAVGNYARYFTQQPVPFGDQDHYILIAKTSDSGESWQHVQIALPKPCSQIRTVLGETYAQPFGELIITGETSAIIGTNYGGMLYTTDSGATWEFTSSPYNSIANAGGCNPIPTLWAGDYKKFEGASVTITGSAYQDIINAVAVGSEAQPKLTAVNNNVAVGYKVQYEGSGSAVDSVEIGSRAVLYGNEILDTVAIGRDTLQTTKYSFATTAVGSKTLFNLIADKSGPTFPVPIINGAFKHVAEFDLTSSKSEYNTVVGYESGFSLAMGDSNTFVGYNAGGFAAIKNLATYGYNNIVIGANASKTELNRANQIAIGNPLNTSAVLWGQYGVPNPWQVYSDGRDKTNTASFATGLEFIRNLDVKSFKWDSRAMYPAASGSPDGTYMQSTSSYGYIAQDVEAAAIAAGLEVEVFVSNTSASYYDKSGSYDAKIISPGMIELMTYNAVKQLDSTVTYLSSSKYTTNLGNGSNLSYGVTHSLGTRDVIAMVYGNSSNLVVYPTMSINSTNTMTVTFNTIPSTNEYRLVVMR